MSNSYFKFKQFTIHQDKCAMKVGTDGAILGAWVPLPTEENPQILDIGCGTGVISLMIAQRLEGKAQITGIDIDEGAAIQASENAAISSWAKQISIYHTALQDFSPNTKFNLIVSNPPYFTKSLKNPDAQKSKARHNDELPLLTLATFASKNLTQGGHLAVILPPQEAGILENECFKMGMKTVVRTNVHFKAGATPKRTLLTIEKTNTEENPQLTEDDLTLAEAGTDNNYTTQFKTLVRDFYLHIE
ncbi:MAG: methyltransferase [Bacteroidales bacterium]|nr:methyltransferase [Candidatus Physcocola equi]